VIKLTNATDQHKGNPIHINPEWIVAIFENATTDGGSLRTIVYGGPQGTSWEVEESPSDVAKMINVATTE
jgi:hypothetical protein